MTEEIKIQENSKSKIKKRKIIIPVILIIIGLISGLLYYINSTKFVSTDDAYIIGHNIQISPKISGNVTKVYFDDNQKVKKGQLLVEIDETDYKVKYEQALAKLQAAEERYKSTTVNTNLTAITSNAGAEQANSAVDGAKALVKVSEKQIYQQNADIDSIKAEVELAQADFERYDKLYKKGASSKQDFDRSLTNYKSQKAKLDVAQSMLQAAYLNKEAALHSLKQALEKSKGADTASEQVAISNAQSKMAMAEIKQLQAALKQTELDLSYTKIYAPSDGAITNKAVEAGIYVQIGQPLFAIIPKERWIIANFKETQLTNMKIGQPVLIKVDSYPDKEFKGKVDSIQAGTGAVSSLFPPENAVGSFIKVVQRVPVKIIFTEKIDPKYVIVPGMSVIPEVKVK